LTLRVGLTGGIACGKSRVLRRLDAAGLETLDLDRIAHQVTAPGGPAHRDVLDAFGPGILGEDGGIDRKRLGDLVFSDPAARARLDAIVHPLIREEEARRVALRPDHPGRIVVTDAALLVEAGVHLRFDRLVVVHCQGDEQVRRLMERDGIEEPAARARIAAQMPLEEKRRFAHVEIDTSGDLRDTDRAADRLAFELRRLARARPGRAAIPLERRLAAMVTGPRSGPRGLDRGEVLADIAAAGGLEMERVKRLLAPPAHGPWYRAARPQGEEEGPEALAPAVAVWALSRGGPDLEFLAAAAASLARLTHSDPERIAGACLYAIALQEAMLHGPNPALLSSLPGWTAVAGRWGGAAPTQRLMAAVESAALATGRGVSSSSVPASLLETLAALDGS
jgi:dephospho-CoA kinase